MLQAQVLAFLLVSMFHANVPASAGAVNTTITDFASHSYLNGTTKLSTSQRKDIECYAKVVWYEARGESKHGKILVANVVRNRMKFGKPFANTVCDVVYQRNQFAWTRESKKKHAQWKSIMNTNWKTESKQVWDTLNVATNFAVLNAPDVTDATHFCTATEKCNFKRVEGRGRYGGHKFYKYLGNK